MLSLLFPSVLVYLLPSVQLSRKTLFVGQRQFLEELRTEAPHTIIFYSTFGTSLDSTYRTYFSLF